jgi:hypothetical protein
MTHYLLPTLPELRGASVPPFGSSRAEVPKDKEIAAMLG